MYKVEPIKLTDLPLVDGKVQESVITDHLYEAAQKTNELIAVRLRKESADIAQNTRAEIKAILDMHGIQLAIGGCGCCGSPWVTFIYKDKVLWSCEDDANFSNLKKETQNANTPT